MNAAFAGGSKLRRAAGVLLAAVAALSGLSRMERNPDQIPALAHEWAQSNLSSMPTTAAELAAYPKAYREAAFHAVSPDVRLAIVSEGLQHALKAKGVMNPEQQAYLETLLSRIRSAAQGDSLNSALGDPAVDGTLQECRLQEALFPDDTLRASLKDSAITQYVEPRYSVSSARTWTRELARSLAMRTLPQHVIADDGAPTCNCNSSTPYCDCGSTTKCRTQSCASPPFTSCASPTYWWSGCFITHGVVCNAFCAGGDEEYLFEGN